MDGVRRRGERRRREVRAAIVVRPHVFLFIVIRNIAGRLLVEVVMFISPRAVLFAVAVAVALMTDFAFGHSQLRHERVAVEIGRTGTGVGRVISAPSRGEVRGGRGPRRVSLAGSRERYAK